MAWLWLLEEVCEGRGGKEETPGFLGGVDRPRESASVRRPIFSASLIRATRTGAWTALHIRTHGALLSEPSDSLPYRLFRSWRKRTRDRRARRQRSFRTSTRAHATAFTHLLTSDLSTLHRCHDIRAKYVSSSISQLEWSWRMPRAATPPSVPHFVGVVRHP